MSSIDENESVGKPGGGDSKRGDLTSDEDTDKKPSPKIKGKKSEQDSIGEKRSRRLDSPSRETSDEDDSDHRLSPTSKRGLEQWEGEQSEKSMTEEERKLEAKRAYNRANAARARKRVKEQLVELCQKVETASDKYDKLKEKNDELEKLVVSLNEENQMLRRVLAEQRVTSGIAAGSRVEDREAIRRLLVERGEESASLNLARLHAGTSNLAAGTVPPQLSSIVNLPPSYQQSIFQLQQGSSNTHNPSQQQVYPYLNQSNAWLPRMPPNHPSFPPDGRM
jgi:hypothetical protein